jgi:Fibronectin type III domain/Bacterial Ig-like domain (group 1)
MSVISRVGRKSLALTLTSAMTAVLALVGVSSAHAAVATATIRLLEDDKAPKAMTNKTYWSAPRTCTPATSCDYVKMITAGSDLVLHYNVKDASGVALSSTLVTLNVSVPEGATAGTFTGSLTGTTNSSGDVTFTLRNTNTSANSEPYPIGRSNLGYWDDSRGDLIAKATQYNIVPTVGAATEVVDTVMTHVVKTPVAAANIRLTSGDKALMSDKTYWASEGGVPCDPTITCSYVKFVGAGYDLNLHYVVKDDSGHVLANTPIALNLGQPDGAIATAYSGDLYKTTDADGAVTFALHNTATSDQAEPRPSGKSTMIYWEDHRVVDQVYALDFTPSVGASTENVDRVWSHTIKPAALPGTANIYLTATDRAGMDDKSKWWTNESASYSRLKFVFQGKDLVLHYVVTDDSGNPIANKAVTLATTSEHAGATFTGELTKNTDANGAVTFTLKNTNAPSAAEDYPYSPSSVTHWDDTRDGLSPQYEMDFVPTAGADFEHVDRVWAHIIKTGAPTAPQGVNIKVASATSAVVSWSAPVDDGGSAVTGYTYTLKNNGVAVSGATGTVVGTSATVSGLLASGKYSVSVTATNAAGSSSAASSVGTVTPVVVTAVKAPAAVTKPVAVAGNTSVTLTWTAPTSNNNASLVNYSVAIKAGANLVKTVLLPADTTILTASKVAVTGAVITGLTNGTAYTFIISATNAIGSTAAAATTAVTPCTLPDAPTKVSVTSSDASLNVGWTAPASTGGYAMSGYVVTYTPTVGAAKTVTAAAGATSVVIPKLVNGTTYSVTVQAKNANKDTKSNLSANSASVTGTPSTVPVALKTVTGVAGTGQVTVSWTAVADTATAPANGGSPITGYDIVAKQGTTVVASEHTNWIASSKVITGLTKGVSYTFTVTAINVNGSSVAKVSTAVKPL